MSDPPRPRPLAHWASLIAVAALIAVALAAALAPFVMPANDANARRLAAGGIFAASYLALAIGRVPGLAIDRAGIALVGASLMVASGAISAAGGLSRDRYRHASRCCSA